MSPHDPFLNAILASPLDDTPRLLYADWLEDERRSPRGEFIRVQIELAARPPYDPERRDLEARLAPLEEGYSQLWRPPDLTGVTWGPFRRGFIETMRVLKFSDFEITAERAFAAAPVVELIYKGIACGDTGVAEVAASPWTERLARLNLADNRISGIGAQALASSPGLAGLKGLELWMNPLGIDGFRAIARGPWTELESLGLGICGGGTGGVQALAESPVLAHLRELDLSYAQIQDQGAAAVARSKHLGQLRALDLRRNNLRAGGLQSLASSPTLDRLTSLVLSGNSLGDAGARLLAQGHLVALESLVLASCELGPAGASSLARSPLAARLRSLVLPANSIGDDGAEGLAGGEWPRLVRLDLSSCGIGERGAMALAVSPWLAHVDSLDLSHNPLKDAGVKHLASSPYLAGLRWLGLRATQVAGAGGRALAESHSLSPSARLSLALNRLEDSSTGALKARFGSRVQF